jgi:CRISPR-associated protein Cas5h
MKNLLSFDIKADFGMLKKPDTNEPVYLTFNMLHKPALLGILGAIGGFPGFSKNGELPEYYQILKNVQVGIMPLPNNTGESHHENGNFTKTIIKYNNTTGLASEEAGGNLMIAEQTLIAPAFRCFVLLDKENAEEHSLIKNLLNYHAEFVPYLGKNECSLWWENARMVDYLNFVPEGTFKISSLFLKSEPLKNSKVEEPLFDILMESSEGNTFTYFENLPIAYLGAPLFQYEFGNFAYTDWDLSLKQKSSGNFIKLRTGEDAGKIIQLF